MEVDDLVDLTARHQRHVAGDHEHVAIRFAFGTGSFSAHKAAAEAAGIEPRIVHLPGFALDIDNPMDLRTLLTYDSETETLAYLSDSGIARRILPRHNGGPDNSDIAAASRLI